MKTIFKMPTTKELSLEQVLREKKDHLGIYFSAGYPFLESTVEIIEELKKNGVDFIEVGMPYSDPLADGPTIESAHARALKNGMSMDHMFGQLNKVKEKSSTPLVLMGYYNPVYRYGLRKFCERCKEAGITILILPDMPVELYAAELKETFDEFGISVVFLATPDTPDERLKLIDEHSRPFIYLVSSSSTTGQTKGIQEEQARRFKEVKEKLKTPVCVGFGISTHEDYKRVNENVDGAIVGSAFLKALENVEDSSAIKLKTAEFIKNLKG